MHDANGTELKKGDRVMIECVITEVHPHEEFCNATVQPRPMRGRDPELARAEEPAPKAEG